MLLDAVVVSCLSFFEWRPKEKETGDREVKRKRKKDMVIRPHRISGRLLLKLRPVHPEGVITALVSYV